MVHAAGILLAEKVFLFPNCRRLLNEGLSSIFVDGRIHVESFIISGFLFVGSGFLSFYTWLGLQGHLEAALY